MQEPERSRRLGGLHRGLGVCSAVFLIFLGVTGILLMNSDRLGWPAGQVQSRWLLDWYGIRPPPAPRGQLRDGHWFSESGGHLYFDTRAIPQLEGVLLGAFRIDDEGGEWLVVTDIGAAILDDSGSVLERFGREAGLPAGLVAAGQDSEGAIILATTGARFRFESASGEFVPAPLSDRVEWSSSAVPPQAIATAIARGYGGDGVSYERVLLDLHSGRLFGTIGVLAVNLSAVLLSFLAASGLWLWFRRRRCPR